MFRAVLLFCAVLALGKGQITLVNQCSDSSAGHLPLLTIVEGCRTPPCELTQGQDIVISMIFQAPHVIHNMRTMATAYINFLPLPLDLNEHSEACNFLINTYCPVEQGELIVYTLRIPIEKLMPVGIQLPFEFSIIGDNTTAMTCARVVIGASPSAFNKLGAQTTTMPVEV